MDKLPQYQKAPASDAGESSLVKAGGELGKQEINQINQARAREFKASPLNEKQPETTLFFLLLDHQKILAMGELIPVNPIKFNKEVFSVLGIGGILANEKGKGYGKKIMLAIKNYLISQDKTGVGFCGLNNKGFYGKCGFKIETTSIKRFVFQEDSQKITNSGDEGVVYLDGSDRFMEKVLLHPDQEVMFPRPPDW